MCEIRGSHSERYDAGVCETRIGLDSSAGVATNCWKATCALESPAKRNARNVRPSRWQTVGSNERNEVRTQASGDGNGWCKRFNHAVNYVSPVQCANKWWSRPEEHAKGVSTSMLEGWNYRVIRVIAES